MCTTVTLPARLYHRTVANVLLLTSNGTGMGHLTRQLAVARAAPDSDNVTVMSLSVGAPVLVSEGIDIEYCPSYDRGWIPSTSWHAYLRDRIVALVDERDIDVVMFDGVAPYPGVLRARQRLPHVGFAWMRRGMWRPDTNVAQLAKSIVFDIVIEPGDVAGSADRGPTAARGDAVRVPPVSLIEVIDRPGRVDAARSLGIDPDRPALLLTLGSGMLGDVATPGRLVTEFMSRHPDWQVCVTRPRAASNTVPVRSDVRELVGVYPLARYLAAFDGAVSAAGYNAVHELVPAGLPTLFVPNALTKTDDQVERSRWLAANGLALTARSDDHEALGGAMQELLDESTRAGIKASIDRLDRDQLVGGAAATASELGQLAATRHIPMGHRVRRRAQLADLAVREFAKSSLGAERTDRLRDVRDRWRLRHLTEEDRAAHQSRFDKHHLTPVKMSTMAAALADPTRVPAPLVVDHVLSADLLAAGFPYEHVLPETSPSYRIRRERIAERWYVIDGV